MKRILILQVFILLSSPLFSQSTYVISPESKMTITGTSTIHDWTSKVNVVKGDVVFTKNAKDKNFPKSGTFIQNTRIEIPVKSIESPRGVVMDDKTYEALKSEEHPTLIFNMKSSEITGITDKINNIFNMNITGDLTVAGFTRTISFSIKGQRLPDFSFRFEGSYGIKMTDYNVKPPTAMFGQIVTGDDVVIAFDILLKEK